VTQRHSARITFTSGSGLLSNLLAPAIKFVVPSSTKRCSFRHGRLVFTGRVSNSLEEADDSLSMRTPACRRSFRWSLSRSRRHSSSGGIGTPLQVNGRTLCAGRPGFLRVCSFLRHLARRFWNHTFTPCTTNAGEHISHVFVIIIIFYSP